jgi:bifunctional non-homologous end joining protein LigD
MLLTERTFIPAKGDWLYEIKYDGYRFLAATGEAQLQSRNGHVATRWFPQIAEAMATLAPGCILDGEVCVLDDLGRPDFDRLHKRAARRGRPPGSDPVVFSVFDLLVLDGEDVRDQPVEDRKAALRGVLDCCTSVLLYVQDVEDGQGLYQHAVAG